MHAFKARVAEANKKTAEDTSPLPFGFNKILPVNPFNHAGRR
jgi:hypothetical protein